MIRDNLMNRSTFLIALSLCVLGPSFARGQDTYAAVEIHNITIDVTVSCRNRTPGLAISR